MGSRVLGLVGSGAGGVQELLPRLIRPAQNAGWTVVVTLTPTAARWLGESGALAQIEEASGFPVRVDPRSPTERSPHPQVDCYLVAPASANTIAKLALGIYDNQALTQVNEAIGTRDLPVVVFPRVNAAHARHPSWGSHIAALRRAGVHLVYGDEVWPLHEPRSAPGRELPWSAARRGERGRSRRTLARYCVYPDSLSGYTPVPRCLLVARARLDAVRPRHRSVGGHSRGNPAPRRVRR